jgi:hypothetical protein
MAMITSVALPIEGLKFAHRKGKRNTAKTHLGSQVHRERQPKLSFCQVLREVYFWIKARFQMSTSVLWIQERWMC